MKEIMHMTIEIAGNALLAERRRRAAVRRDFPIYPGSQPARGLPKIVKQAGLKLLDVKIIPRTAAPVSNVDLRSSCARALFSSDVVKRSAFSFSMVTCFES